MSRFIDRLTTKGILVNDPTKAFNNRLPGDDYLNTLNNASPYKSGPIEDPFDRRLRLMEEEMKFLKTELKLSRLKILFLEKKFTQDEVTNIRKMLMSNDEASITLANSIIDNA